MEVTRSKQNIPVRYFQLTVDRQSMYSPLVEGGGGGGGRGGGGKGREREGGWRRRERNQEWSRQIGHDILKYYMMITYIIYMITCVRLCVDVAELD